jgi:HEXXH motif-containing protein
MTSALSLDQLRELGRGGGDARTLTQLRNAQLGKRRLVLAAAVHAVGGDHAELLSAAEGGDSAACDVVVGDPFTDVWAAHWRSEGHAGESATRHHLDAITMAAAALAGLDFTLTTYCADGSIFLPSLGTANGLGPGPVSVVGCDRRLTLRGVDGAVAVDLNDPVDQPPYWRQRRQITVGHGDDALTLDVEDSHPYRSARCSPRRGSGSSRIPPSMPHRSGLASELSFRW